MIGQFRDFFKSFAGHSPGVCNFISVFSIFYTYIEGQATGEAAGWPTSP